jgi:hypothetical protein
MSRFNKLPARSAWRAAATRVGTPLVIIALGCAAAATLASDHFADRPTIGATVIGLSDEARAGAMRSLDDRPSGGRSAKGGRSLFRCWQDGRMIYEGRGYSALPKSQVTAELNSGDPSGTVQVLDLYQGLCVLELPK